MAHTNERIYIGDSGIGWKADLQPFFGVIGGLGYITQHAVINRWNRYKPFRHQSVNFTTSGQSRGDRWNAAQSVNFGLDIKSYTGLSGLNNLLTAAKSLGEGTSDDNCAWGYLRPRGMSYDEPFRVYDFDEYVKNLNPILEETINPKKKYRVDKYQWFVNNTKPQDQLHNISLEDLGLASHYIGIAYRPKSSSSVTAMKCVTKTATGELSTTMALGTDYDAALFFSPRQLSSVADISSGDVFHPLPFPYLEIGSYNDNGLTIRGVDARYLGSSLNVIPKSICLGGARTITKVRLCHRKTGNYWDNGDGTYRITPDASLVLADNEDDYEFNGLGQIDVPESSVIQNFPRPDLLSMVSLDIDPYSGRTFVQFTTTHLYNGRLIEDDTFTFPFQYTLPPKPVVYNQ